MSVEYYTANSINLILILAGEMGLQGAGKERLERASRKIRLARFTDSACQVTDLDMLWQENESSRPISHLLVLFHSQAEYLNCTHSLTEKERKHILLVPLKLPSLKQDIKKRIDSGGENLLDLKLIYYHPTTSRQLRMLGKSTIPKLLC